MKPLDFTKPITTRDGRKVRILCTDGPNKSWPVVGYIGNSFSESHWQSNGWYNDNRADNSDLINPPIKRKVEFWVNIYPDSTENRIHESRRDADMYSNPRRIACLHFTREYEEGEGL